MGKTTTICFTNNKGGSGKSTTCSNLGAAMARAGKKVLLVDGDMQLNLSLAILSGGLGTGTCTERENNLYYAIGKQEDLTDYIVHTPYENLDLVPSSTLDEFNRIRAFYKMAERIYPARNACRRSKIQKFMTTS